MLTVQYTLAPSFTNGQPGNQSVTAGGNTSFTATATGTPAPSYQWQVNNGSGWGNVSNTAPYTGATTGTLTITNATVGMTTYQYRCLATNAAQANVTSNAATLTVSVANVAPSFTNGQPGNQSVTAGGNTSFTATATGTPAPSYQWQVNNGSGWGNVSNTASYTGATTGTLTITNATVGMTTYQYRCLATNAAQANVASTAATLTVSSANVAPSFTTQPTNKSVTTSGTTSFTAAASGTPTPTLQWQVRTSSTASWGNVLESSPYSGVTLGTLTITGATAGMNNYQYQCLATNAAQANVASTAATLTVTSVSGAVVAWGSNISGQTDVPVGLSGVVAIAGGNRHSMALKADGTVVAWGFNGDGEINIPASLSNVVGIAAGDWHSMALKADGTVVAWGDNSYGWTNIPAGLSNVVAVAAGGAHSMALKADGTVVAWGSNYYGETNIPAGLSNVVGIAAGDWHSMALKSDGTVVAWGGQTDIPAGLSNVVAIAGGGGHSMALKSDGTVVAWGSNEFGQTAIPTGLNNVVAIAGGWAHSMALKADGTVMAWGLNYYDGQTDIPAGLSNVVAVAAGENHSLALTAGTVSRSIRVVGNLVFGSVAPSATATVTLTIVNSGTSALTVSSLSYPTGFSGNWSGTIPAGRFQNVTVTFAPTAATNYTGNVTVNANQTSGTITLAVSGTGGTSAPLAPTGVAATSNLTDRVTVTWTAPGGATSYDVYRAETNSSNAAVKLNGTTVISVASYDDTTATAGTTYYYFVIAKNTVGPSDFSSGAQGMRATTVTVPAAPTGVAGTSNLTDKVTVTWTASLGATSYDVYRATTNSSSAAVKLNGATVISVASYDDTTATAGTTYYYFVIAKNTVGPSDSSSGAQGVRAVMATAPVNDNFANATPIILSNGSAHQTGSNANATLEFGEPNYVDIFGTSVWWKWTALVGGSVELNTIGSNIAPVLAVFTGDSVGALTLVEADGGNGGNGTSVLTFLAVNGTTYWIMVQANNGDVGSISLNLTQSATPAVPLAPTGVAATSNLSDRVTVTWTATSGATSYDVYRATANSSSAALKLNGATVISVASYDDITATAGTAYYYFVIAKNSGGPSGFSSGAQGLRSATTGGVVVAWGRNDGGQTAIPTGLNNVVAIAGGKAHSLALKSDGSVVDWGFVDYYDMTPIPAGLSNVVAIAAGAYRSMALKSDGAVVAWGGNYYLENNIPAGLMKVVAIAAGEYYSLALKSDGTVVGWGNNYFLGQINIPAGLSNVVAIAAGYNHSMAIKSDGTVVAWGANDSGQINIPAGLSNVVAIAAGFNHSMALKSDGTVVAWGSNSSGQTTIPAGLNNLVAIAAGEYHSMALKSDGTVVAWGANDSGQTTIPASLNNVEAIAAGEYHSMAIKSGVTSRSIRVIGNMALGNVAVGTITTRTLTIVNAGTSPLTVSGLNYPSGFSGNWSGTISAGRFQNVTVTFAPTTATNYSGNVTVNANQTSGSNTLAMSGTGVASAPSTEPGRYSGVYFGTLSGGQGSWALYVRSDNTGLFVAYLAQSKTAFVANVVVNADGTFSVTGTAASLAEYPQPYFANTQPRVAAAPQTFTLNGQINASGQVTGQLGGGASASVSGTVDTPSGAAVASSGLYTAPALNAASGSAYTIVGPSGHTFVVTSTATGADSATGTINATGQLAAVTASGGQLSLSVSAQNKTVAAVVTPSGSNTAVNFAGLAEGVLSTSRLLNLSVLTALESAGDTFTLGYVVGGNGTSGAKPLVIRAAGPSLAQFNVSGVLNDPKIELFAGSTKTGENDNWGGLSSTGTAMAAVGAFAYVNAATKDAATAASITSRDNSVKVSASDRGTGAVIAEVYDATSAASFNASTPRLINVSVLKNIGTGLTAGFVVGGLGTKTVLIRAVGPTLGAAPFNVPGVVADPQLILYSGQTAIGSNNNWGTPIGSGSASAALLNATFTQVGAFALTTGSNDAALLATLAPGDYSVKVTGVANATGVALVEVYEVP